MNSIPNLPKIVKINEFCYNSYEFNLLMLYPIRSYFRDRWILTSFLAGGALQFFQWWYTISRIRPTGEQLFLHYNILFGVDLIGEWWKIYLIPLFSLIILLVNFGLSYFCYQQNRFISRFLVVLTLFYEVLILVGSTLIIGLNI